VNLLTARAVSVLSILKNPMILMGLVSMLIFIGMPYLMDNSTSSSRISALSSNSNATYTPAVCGLMQRR